LTEWQKRASNEARSCRSVDRDSLIAAGPLPTYAIAACVLLGIGVWLGRQTEGPHTVSGAFDGGPNYDKIHQLREDAFDLCVAKQFTECLAKLDEAKALDGSESRDWARVRARAEAALAEAGVRDGGAG